MLVLNKMSLTLVIIDIFVITCLFCEVVNKGSGLY